MRLLMLKLLMIASLLGSLGANSDIVEFEKKRLLKIPVVKVLDIKITHQQKINKRWTGYIIDIKLKDLRKGKIINGKDMLFSDGEVVAPEIFDIKSLKSFKNLLNVRLSNKYYNKEHLILGDIDAKHKMVVFTDPLCPFCIENLPKTYQMIKKSKNIALFYYDFPLTSIHPASDVVSRYIILAKKKNLVKDLIYKVYTANLEKYFPIKETDPNVIVPVLNKILGINLKVKDVISKEIDKELKKSIKMGEDALVRGTPTIFFDGIKDDSREKFKKYLK